MWLVIACGTAAVVYSMTDLAWPERTPEGLAITVFLVAGVLAGEWLPARIWRGDEYLEYTFSGPFTLALIMIGPFWVALLAQTCALLVDEVRKRRPPLKAAFNLSQYALGMTCARAVYAYLTDQPFGASETGAFSTAQLLPSLAAAGSYFLVNVVLVSVVMALVNDERLLTSIVGHFRDEISMTTMLLCVAPIIVLSLQFSLLTAPLCLLSIAAVREAVRAAANSHVQAMHDALTGLPNRSLLLQRSRSIALSQDGTQTALLMLDLDHFKEINDTLGHNVGDELLRQVSTRLSSVMREGDTLARFGGDEFALLCHGVADVRTAERMSQRFVEALAEPFALEQISLHVGASVGIALLPLHASGIEQLVQRADIALYQAKKERGTTCVYDPRSDFSSVARLALMEELRAGLDSQLVLHYQPKCLTSDGSMVGVEALVRWQHPVRGLIPPGQFLPAAETAGLIVPMTMLILRESLRQVNRWRDQGLDLNVAVNMSPRHLTDIRLPDQIQALLEAEGLPGDVLTLEVTENSMMSDPTRVAVVLQRMRSLDVFVSIDDFGTGYSSLAYLRDLSATEVKIDQTFVQNSTASGRDLAIVKAAVELGHSLGLKVVAEGVEDTTTAALMADIGCDLLQGYLILPPAPADELLAWSRRPQVWTRGLLAQQPGPTQEDERQASDR